MLGLALAPAFTLQGAREAGLSKDQVYSLLEEGLIERAGRGIYVRPHALQPDLTMLAAASVLCEEATLCLTSALVHHDLSDAIPFASNIALPRGTHHPASLVNVSWHSFDPKTFEIGRQYVEAGEGVKVAVYSAERTVIDCFRLMHQEGSDVAYEALRRWLRKRDSTPAQLLKVAASFPKALPRIRQALEVLL